MKILVATGSSGGHIFPALGFIEALKEKDRNIDVLLVLPRKSIREQTFPEDYRVKHISVSTVKLSLGFKNIISLFNLLKGFFESLFLMVEYRPDVVVGFGSLNSVPLIILGWLFRTNTIIHEQNVTPGRATRLLSMFADKVAISFAETKDYLKIDQEKIILTGNPIRKDLKRIDRSEALKFFGFNEDRFTVLVVGGSQGSHRINICFMEALSLLSEHNRFQVIHICGTKDFDLLMEKYEDLDLKFDLVAFLKEMQYAYSAADIAISRAGASSVSELFFFGLPSIIVPYPYAYAHQLSNARVLEKIKASVIIKDDKLEAQDLKRLIEDFMNNPDKIKRMRENLIQNPLPDARNLLVRQALSFN